jgi:hypothetical protein
MTAHVRAITVNVDRGRLALCDLDDGQRCWATARSARPGDVVTVAYSRRDASGAPERRTSYWGGRLRPSGS